MADGIRVILNGNSDRSRFTGFGRPTPSLYHLHSRQGRNRLGLLEARERFKGGKPIMVSSRDQDAESSSKHPSEPGVRLGILLADDHQIVRQGLRAILERTGFNVVAEAADGHEAVQRALEFRPDVAVLDLAMPFKNGIEVAKEIIEAVPKTKTIILTMYPEDQYVLQALLIGVRGYVLKTRASADLVEAIRRVAAGSIYLSPGISSDILQYLGRQDLSTIS